MLDDNKSAPEYTFESSFSGYVKALDALAIGDERTASVYLSTIDEVSFFAKHIQISMLMRSMQFDRAKERLLYLLNSEVPLNEIELYTVLSDLEICCRETEDYKNAYHFSSERVQLLEKLLKEV